MPLCRRAKRLNSVAKVVLDMRADRVPHMLERFPLAIERAFRGKEPLWSLIHFGGRFVSNGGSLEKLRVILGHSTTEVTLRYGHLVKGQFTQAERELADVQLRPGKVLPLRGRAG